MCIGVCQAGQVAARLPIDKQSELQRLVREVFLPEHKISLIANIAIQQSLARLDKRADVEEATETLKQRLLSDAMILAPIVSNVDAAFSPEETKLLAEWARMDRVHKLTERLNEASGAFFGCVLKAADEVLAAYPDVEKPSAPASAIVSISAENYQAEVLDSKIPVILDAYATWCGPCKMLSPILEELSQELNGKVKFCKLDIDAEQELAEQLEIASIPTLACFQNGKESLRSVGVLGKEDLLKLIAHAFLAQSEAN